MRDGKLPSDLAHSTRRCSDLDYLFCCQLGVPVALADCAAMPLGRVGAVIGLCADNQMVGPDARGVVAFVANHFALNEPATEAAFALQSMSI